MDGYEALNRTRGGSRAAAKSKMAPDAVNYYHKVFLNYYHKALHLGCCNSPRSAFENQLI